MLGGIAFVLFGIVFFRLWYLQVLTGQEAVTQARDNRVRKVRIEAPRGDIVDRNNVKLVRTKAAAVVQMVPSQLPESVREDADAYRKNLAAAENEPPAGRRTATTRSGASCATTGARTPRPRSRERAALRKAGQGGAPGRRSRPCDRHETELIALYKRMGEASCGSRPRRSTSA